jgi:hypothetical protein
LDQRLAGLLDFLKAASAVSACAFGILGLLTESKNKETGRLTKPGTFALAGILFSMIFALGSQITEDKLSRAADKKSAENVAKQLAASTAVLEQVKRGLYPIRGVQIEYSLELPEDNPLVRNYCFRLSAKIKAARSHVGTSGMETALDAMVLSSREGHVALLIATGPPESPSPLLPDSSDRVLWAAVAYSTLQVDLYGRPIPPGEHYHAAKGGIEPDLILERGGKGPTNPYGTFQLEYSESPQGLRLTVFPSEIPDRDAIKAGPIVSLLDLNGAQMFVRWNSPQSSGGSLSMSELETLADLRRHMKLTDLSITIDNRRFEFSPAQFSSGQTADSFPLLSTKLAPNFFELK